MMFRNFNWMILTFFYFSEVAQVASFLSSLRDFQFHQRRLEKSSRIFSQSIEKELSPVLKLEKEIHSFPGLQSEMFSHPLDSRLVKTLSSIPLIENFLRSIFTSVESALTVENLSSAVLVGPKQMPQLSEQLLCACTTLDMNAPDLYVKQNPIPNAYTLAFRGRRPFIVIHTGLLDLMSEKEVLSVIGHELGHLKCEHGIWVTLLSIMTEVSDTVLGKMLPIRSLLHLWLRSAEYSCDRASLLVTRDYKIVASVLMKLCGGSSQNSFSKEMNVDAFLEQAKELEREKKSASGSLYSLISEQAATHPIPLLRAVELMKWSQSSQYIGLLKRSNSKILNFNIIPSKIKPHDSQL